MNIKKETKVKVSRVSRKKLGIVAKVFNQVMQEFLGYFDMIEYAVYHTEREKGNFETFKNEMN